MISAKSAHSTWKQQNTLLYTNYLACLDELRPDAFHIMGMATIRYLSKQTKYQTFEVDHEGWRLLGGLPDYNQTVV